MTKGTALHQTPSQGSRQKKQIEMDLNLDVSLFLSELRRIDYRSFYCQDDNFERRSGWRNKYIREFVYDMFKSTAIGLPERDPIRERDLGSVKYYTSSKLEVATDGFSNKNVVCRTIFGRLLRGKMEIDGRIQEVLVKTWDFSFPRDVLYELYPSKFCDEIELLMFMSLKSEAQGKLVNLVGYSYDKQLAVVYDFKETRLLHDELDSGNFGWDERMDVALKLAELLQLLHDNLCVLGAVDARYIFVDEEYNMALFDFSLLARIEDKNSWVATDDLTLYYEMYAPDASSGEWSTKSDVFAYGEILLQLIKKEKFDPENGRDGIRVSQKAFASKDSLVDGSFKQDPDTGRTITGLAMSCLDADPVLRPDMRFVTDTLSRLRHNRELKRRKLT